MKNLFTDHPASVNQSYTEHLGSALSFAVPMIAAGLACLIHAVLPFLFRSTGRNTIAKLHDRMVITPGNQRVENWTFPAFDEHGKVNEEIEI